MTFVLTIAYIIVLLFVVALLVRVVFDLVQMMAREWRPQGLVLLAAETVYTTTDPPLKLVRRVLPPVRFGGVALDLAFLVVMIAAWLLLSFLQLLAS